MLYVLGRLTVSFDVYMVSCMHTHSMLAQVVTFGKDTCVTLSILSYGI